GASSDETWTVSAVDVALGDRVTKGQVLASADSAAATLALQQAQADLDKAQAQLADDQAKPTADDTAAAQSTLTKAQMSLDDAKRSQQEVETSSMRSLVTAKSAVSDAQDQLDR